MLKPYAVVTGASEGIGRGFASALAAQHRNLVLVARNQARLQELASELTERHGIDVRVVVQDLAAPGAADAIRSAVADLPIDCLVNNAGFQVPLGPFSDSAAHEVRDMVAVNIGALTDLTHLFLPRIVQAGGAIVNVASHAAFQPVPYMAAYAATKAYVLHFTEALGRELADRHPGRVYTMAFCPGATRTNFWARSASPVEQTRFAVMTVDAVVAVAMRELGRRRRPVVIPSLLLRASTQSLRLSTRSLNLKIARLLTGYALSKPRQAAETPV